MATTLIQIQEGIAGFLDNTASAAPSTGAAWARRTGYINRAQQEWSEVFDWRNLYKEYNAVVSAPSGMTSYAMPADFRRPAGHPIRDGEKYSVITAFTKVDMVAGDRIAWVLGTPGSYTLVMRWNTVAAGLASLTVPYYSTPTALSTTGAISPCPDPEYLIAKAIAMELRSLVKDHESAGREDARADLILRRMIETENVPSYGTENRIIASDEKRGFIFGQD